MLTPLPAKDWKLEHAAHLLNRAGFGGTPGEVEAFHAKGLNAAVDSLLAAPDDSAQFPKPEWAHPVNQIAERMEMKAMDEEARKKASQMRQKGDREQMTELIGWWLNRMRHTPAPLREKMTLFWHGHFATSFQKVRNSYLMWLQNETLRTNALGNFGTMVKLVARDPAMMIWLDTKDSQRAHPNENFGRELMELFTLGIGNYTENDIQEAARAFTGFKLNPADLSFRYAELQQDTDPKTFLQKTGNFLGDDIIDIILARRECSNYISHKIWEFFAYDNPSEGVTKAISDLFANSKHEIAPLLSAMFRSREFYSPEALRVQVKSPVQFIVQTCKQLETQLPPARLTSASLRELGQIPFSPPSVKGWDGGRAWISTSSLLGRYNTANFLVGNATIRIQRPSKNKPGFREARNPFPPMIATVAPDALRNDPVKLFDSLEWRLFNGKLPERERERLLGFLREKPVPLEEEVVFDLLHLMTSTPHYQLT